MVKIRLPILLTATCHLGRFVSCGNFAFPSHYLPLPILEVSCHVVNSSSDLITCYFPSWTSRLLWQIRLPISLPATSHLGRPISCGKFVFPSHYLLLPILDVCVFLEVLRFLSNLIIFPLGRRMSRESLTVVMNCPIRNTLLDLRRQRPQQFRAPRSSPLAPCPWHWC